MDLVVGKKQKKLKTNNICLNKEKMRNLSRSFDYILLLLDKDLQTILRPDITSQQSLKKRNLIEENVLRGEKFQSAITQDK